MAKKRNWISLKIRREIISLPCVICGCTYRICTDHIIPVNKGGGNERSNLQPLCWQCNAKKGDRLTNAELKEWFEENRDKILAISLRAAMNHGKNPFDI